MELKMESRIFQSREGFEEQTNQLSELFFSLIAAGNSDDQNELLVIVQGVMGRTDDPNKRIYLLAEEIKLNYLDPRSSTLIELQKGFNNGIYYSLLQTVITDIIDYWEISKEIIKQYEESALIPKNN